MPVCAVLTCTSSTEDPDVAAKGLSFHPFPTNKEVQDKWVDMTGMENWHPKEHSVVCSKHFRDNDYIIKRSGLRYLKTAAIPCEYVVYRDLLHQPFVERPATPMFERRSSEVDSTGIDEHYRRGLEQSFGDRPPALLFEIGSSEVDSTSIDDYHRDLEPTERPAAPIFERRSSEIDSTGIDVRYHGALELAMNPSPPLYFSPILDDLAPPMAPVVNERVSLGEIKRSKSKSRRKNGKKTLNVSVPLDLSPSMEGLAPPMAAIAAAEHERVALDKIMRLASKRKPCKKAVSVALACVKEARAIDLRLQSGMMNAYEQAEAIIGLQNKEIVKETMERQRLSKKLKKISGVARNMKAMKAPQAMIN